MNQKIILFTDTDCLIMTKAECALKLHISVRTINRHLLSGKPTRKGWFFDEIIENYEYNENGN